MKANVPQKDRFLLVSKRPKPLDFLVPSAISPQSLDPDKLFQVLLRFETPRPYHHPDDNDLLLACAPELFECLREGMRGTGTWEGKRLLSFVPDSAA